MKFMLLLVGLSHVALASLPLHPGGIGGLFKGPNSEIIIKGPDGSIITAAAEGGAVVTNLQPIVVAEPEVIATPVVVETASVEPSADLVGPSGRIITQGSKSIVAGPASTTVTGPGIITETVVRGLPLVAATPVVSATSVPIITAELAPQAVATASVSPHISFASATSADGSLATALASGNQAIASIETLPLPTVSSTLSPFHGLGRVSLPAISSTLAPPELAVEINGISQLPNNISPFPSVTSTIAPDFLNVNNQIALANPQLIQDQLAIDNKQLIFNPTLIPPRNIVPPEIGINRRLLPRPDIVTTPGLGAATGPNIQRGENSVAVTTTLQPTTGVQNQIPPFHARFSTVDSGLRNDFLFTPTEDPRLIEQQRLPNLAIQQQQQNAFNARRQQELINQGNAALQQQQQGFDEQAVIQQQQQLLAFDSRRQQESINQQQQLNLAFQQQQGNADLANSAIDAQAGANANGQQTPNAPIISSVSSDFFNSKSLIQQQEQLNAIGVRRQQELINQQQANPELAKSAIDARRQQQVINAANIQQAGANANGRQTPNAPIASSSGLPNSNSLIQQQQQLFVVDSRRQQELFNQQQQANPELAKSVIDAGRQQQVINAANIQQAEANANDRQTPDTSIISSVSNLGLGLSNFANINDVPYTEAWGRYGRETKNKN